MSAYHKEHKHSFISRAAGLAAIGTLVGLGVTKGAPIFGRVAEEALGSNIGQKLLNVLADFTRTPVQNNAQIASELFSAEGNIISRASEAIERTARTALTSERRSQSIISNLRPYADNHQAFDSPEFQEAIRQAMGRVTAAEDPSRVPAGFHTLEGLEHFNSLAKKWGVTFNFESLAQQHAHLMDFVREAGTTTITQDEINAYLQKSNVQEQVYQTISQSRKQFQAQAQELYHRFTPPTDSNARRQIKYRDLFWTADPGANPAFDKKIHDAVVAQIQKDMHMPEDRARLFLQQHMEKTQEQLTRVFGNSPTSIHQQTLWNDFLESNTGMTIGARGKVVNWHRPTWIAQELLEKTLLNVQIPLVPYHFNVSLKSLRIAPKIRDLAKGLGLVSENPEIRRYLDKAWKGQGLPYGSTHLVSVGDQMLALGQQGATHLQGRFAVYDARNSSMMRRLAEARSMDTQHILQDIWKIRPDAGQSRLKQLLYAWSPKFAVAVPSASRGGLVVRGKNPFAQILTQYLYGSEIADPRKIHPQLLSDMIHAWAPHDMVSAELHYSTLSSLIRESGQNLTNSAKVLKAYAEWGRGMMPDFAGKSGGQSGTSVLHQLYLNIDQPDVMIQELFRGLGQHQGRSLLELTSEAKESFNPQLYQALMSATRGYRGLTQTSRGEGSFLQHIRTAFRGESGMSQMMERLQRGLLSQMVSDMGASRYGGYSALSEEVLRIHGLAKSGISFNDILKSAPADHPAARFVQDLQSRLGVDNILELNNFLNRLVHEVHGTPKAHVGHMGELASLLLDKEQILGLSDNNLIRAKILNQVRVSLESWPLPVEVRNLHLRSLMFDESGTHEWLTDAVRQRFHALRPFHPQDLGSNPLYDPHTYSIPLNPDTDITSWLTNPLGTAREQVMQGMGVGDYARSLVDPQHPYGVGAMYQHLLGMIPQSVAENVGLNLHSSDLSTPLRTSFAWWAKRVLPLYVGIELYKNLNANAHQLGLPGADDLGANFVANLNRMGAGFKDFMGVTSISQHLVRQFPGLDQYFHPRSKDEYEQYLFYGEEEVREGRGWFTGSRDPLTGGRISHVRPNFFRRWHSHWTEADNVDISNAAHSWLPSPLHPLAPLNRLMHPNWFVNKHLADRPYRSGGVKGPGEDPGSYLVSNAYQPDGTFVAEAGIGGGYPTSMHTLWHQDVILGAVGQSMVPGPGMGGGAAVQGSERVTYQLHKDMASSAIRGQDGFWNWTVHKINNVRSKAGLVGAFLNKLPGFPDETGVHRQNWHAAISNDRLLYGGEYGELTGSLGEFFRRLINPAYINPQDYNTLPNNQPSWMPAKFRRGDPYLRSPGGEFNVPGDAYEQLNPWIAPLKVRGSALGGSVQEIIQKWLYPTQPLGGDDAEDIVEFGSRAHKLIQRQLSSRGVLVGAEVPIYDELDNISGTIDAVVRGMQGSEIWDIKTQGGSHWGEVPEKYIDQVTAYMAIMGIPRGGLAFVNRDDPDQVRFVRFNFDPQRWERILGRIQEARAQVQEMVAKGQISPFETYDLLARIDVLSRVAPDSAEFRDLVEYASKSGGFGGFEHQRFEQAMTRAKHLRQNYRLYPGRYIDTETRRLTVEGITNEGQLLTEFGVVELAGVKWDPQAFSHEDPEQVLARFGVVVGQKLPMTMLKGQFDPELMADMNVKVQIGRLNQRLIDSEYAGPDQESNHPLALRVQGDVPGVIGRIWEHLVHSDNMVTNKFLRVRTALEQLERGEIYGTDDFRWSHIYSTLVVPTIHSVISKNPVSAALKGMAVGAIFLKSEGARTKGALIGAGAGFVLSTVRAVFEAVSGAKWKPRRVRQQEAFDQYWDMLEYVKFSTMAEAAKARALKYEGTDLNQLEGGASRANVSLGPWGALAIHAQRKAQQTMYGYDELHGSLQQALQAIPGRHRQLAESIIETGSISEKRRFYDLISNSERRVLGRFLGVDESSLPTKPSLHKFFANHYLPNVDWAGWAENVDLEDLRTRSADAEGMKVERPNRNRVERAQAYTQGIRIPKMKAHTPLRIKSTINRLMSKGNFSQVRTNFVTRPASKNVINIKFDLHHDQTDELIAQAQAGLYGQ